MLLSGEPGIGKSRLGQVLRERVSSEGYLRLEARCSPYYQNSALYPVIDFLQRTLQFKREDAPEAKLKKLEAALELGAPGQRKSQAEAVPLQPEVIPLFASPLSLPLPERYPPLTLTPQKQHERTLQAILSWLLRLGARRCRDKERRGLPRCARVWLPSGPQARSSYGPFILPCPPRHMRKRGRAVSAQG